MKFATGMAELCALLWLCNCVSSVAPGNNVDPDPPGDDEAEDGAATDDDESEGAAGQGGGNEPSGQAGQGGAPPVEDEPKVDAAPREPSPDGGESPTPTPQGRVPMFLAVGPGLRTTISCDDGLSWVENRFEKERDDDFSHDETNIHGALFANGKFYYPAGWGFSTTRVFASENGVDWERLYLGGAHQANAMAAGGGVLIFGEGRTIYRSEDDGRTWKSVTLPDGYSHFRIAYGESHGGRFVVGGREKRHAYSTDGGKTWTKGQGDGGHRPIYGGGVYVSFQEHGGSLARSDDGGATWKPISCCGNPTYIAHVTWTGTQFLLFKDNTVWSSTNGVEWAQQVVSGMGRYERFAAMARDPGTGTFVAAAGGTPTKFLRSTDGVRWTTLAADKYDARGADIKYITFGHGRPSARCPLP